MALVRETRKLKTDWKEANKNHEVRWRKEKEEGKEEEKTSRREFVSVSCDCLRQMKIT